MKWAIMKTLRFELVSIGEAARYYGVSVATVRRWERLGKLKPYCRTLGNHRRYKLNEENRITNYLSVVNYPHDNT